MIYGLENCHGLCDHLIHVGNFAGHYYCVIRFGQLAELMHVLLRYHQTGRFNAFLFDSKRDIRELIDDFNH